ncbi:MAG: glycosyltransferase family 4 protein [Candidatus Eremiobacteraeota bacterium]|nr:glycosyltransferase family 4 protein [Candidatus Eremiobacteraeota bacterium]
MEPWNTLHVTTIGITAYCFLRSWFSYLTSSGHKVSLACTATEFIAELEATGARVINVPMERSAHPLKDFVSLGNLYRLMRKGSFDSVHTHTTKAGFLGRLAARLAGVPLVLHTIHDLPSNSAKNPILRHFYNGLERIAASWCDHIVTVSYANLEDIRKWKIAPLHKVTVIREGIELENYRMAVDRAAKRKELGIPEGAAIVGTVARLEAAKGHQYLLQAVPEILKQAPETFFVLVGRGHLREKLERQAQELGISSRVLFTGFREDMLEIMSTFDLFMLPSLWEGLGIVLLEAMAFKIPVVASRVGGITDVVIDGETGFLVPPRDERSLAESALRLLMDPEKGRLMGEKGYLRVAEEFQERVANERMMELYARLMKEKRG